MQDFRPFREGFHPVPAIQTIESRGPKFPVTRTTRSVSDCDSPRTVFLWPAPNRSARTLPPRTPVRQLTPAALADTADWYAVPGCLSLDL